MQFGLSFPNFGAFAEPGLLADLAVRAEGAGWDGFFVWDHVVVADGVPVADPWICLGAIARTTARIRLGPMVAALPRHRPWIVARQSVSLDRLSGGRMILGVGLGSPPAEEFGTFHDPTDVRIRAAMLDEGLDIIEGVWSNRPFGYEGSHYRLEETTFSPPSLQQPRIPIWVAGMVPNRRPFRRAARYDGVFPMRSDMAAMTPAEVRTVKAYVDEHRSTSGPYDYVLAGGPLGNDEYHELAAAGLTWYLRLPSYEPEPLEQVESWISAGPDVSNI